MSVEGNALARAHAIINAIERGINEHKLTPAFLDTAQRHVDAADKEHFGTPEYNKVYSLLLEAQTLIYGESGEEQKALKFLKEAVRETGSIHGLHSQLLKDYIAEHMAFRREKHHAKNMHAHKQTAHPRSEVRESRQSQPELAPKPAEFVNEPVHATQPAHRASKFHLRINPSRKLRVAAATAFGILVLGGVGFAFHVPQVSALVTNHGKVGAAKQKYEKLTAAYQDCSTKLAAERGHVDTNDLTQLSNYNQDVTACQNILQQQHQAADAYNTLVGAH